MRFVVLFTNLVKKFSGFLNGIAGITLVFIMLLTCADVVLRFFKHPILGTYELVGLGGAVIAAFAIPQTAIERGHVAVRLLVEKLPPRIQTVVYLIVHILSVILFALIAWECARYGMDLKAGGEVSLTLKIPFYPVLYGISFACIVVCLVLIGDIIFTITAGPWDWYHKWEE